MWHWTPSTDELRTCGLVTYLLIHFYFESLSLLASHFGLTTPPPPPPINEASFVPANNKVGKYCAYCVNTYAPVLRWWLFVNLILSAVDYIVSRSNLLSAFETPILTDTMVSNARGFIFYFYFIFVFFLD